MKMYRLSWNRKYSGGELIASFLWGAAVGLSIVWYNLQVINNVNANHKLPPNIDPDTALCSPSSPSPH
jgi:hypothetical protein